LTNLAAGGYWAAKGKGVAGNSSGRGGWVPFSGTLNQIVRHLARQPLFLFLLGGGIVLLGAGVWGPQSLRILVYPLLALFGAGVMAWVILEFRRQGARGGGAGGIQQNINASHATISNSQIGVIGSPEPLKEPNPDPKQD
jgi:hypothetical protein